MDRPNGLVRLLSALRVSRIVARPDVLLAILLLNDRGRSSNGERGEMHGVGTHIGDVPCLVELLRQAHREPDGIA